jgi:hypothetical protein
MNTFDMVRGLVAQLDAVTARNYPTFDKYAARAGALEAVLNTTLARLTDEQKESWVREQAAVHAIQMSSEVKV